MACLRPSSLTLLFVISLALTTICQIRSPSSSPDIDQCGPRLLPLIPCAPFMEGTAKEPTQPCCDKLKQLYTQEPHCLCLLLNETSSAFPIDTTLALQLPSLCALQSVNGATCSAPRFQPAERPTSSTSVKLRTETVFTMVMALGILMLVQKH